jgi:hypothetical protein
MPEILKRLNQIESGEDRRRKTILEITIRNRTIMEAKDSISEDKLDAWVTLSQPYYLCSREKIGSNTLAPSR